MICSMAYCVAKFTSLNVELVYTVCAYRDASTFLDLLFSFFFVFFFGCYYACVAHYTVFENFGFPSIVENS